MKQIQGQLLRIGQIAGMFYGNSKGPSDNLTIYGIGAPVAPDNGRLPDAPFILRFDTDLFVPDYIGYGRSDGTFTPRNCIKTFLELNNSFLKGCIGKSTYLGISQNMKYKNIFFIGRSFGGMYVSLLPRFNKEIKNLCLISPILDYVACGKIEGEEKTDGFMKAMKIDGYKHLYRGILRNIWARHLANKDGLCPMDNIPYLKNTKIFIAHGKKDKNINFSHSVKFHSLIKDFFMNKEIQIFLKLYGNGDHSFITSNRAIVDFFRWTNLKERK